MKVGGARARAKAVGKVMMELWGEVLVLGSDVMLWRNRIAGRGVENSSVERKHREKREMLVTVGNVVC